MTKPVQIQRLAMKGFQPEGYPPPLCLPHKRGPYCLYSEAIAHEQAALLQVRSLLEAKAKEWRDESHVCRKMADESSDTEHVKYLRAKEIHRGQAAYELLSLAATLGNQGK